MTVQTLAPPRTSVGPLAWLRANLFSGWFSAALTLISALVLLALGRQVVEWAVTDARWSVITNNLRLFLIGQYPADQAWRLLACLTILSVLAGLSMAAYGRTTRILAISLSALQAILAVLAAISPLGAPAALAFALNAALVWLSFIISIRAHVPRRLILIGWLASVPVVFILLGGISTTALPSVGSHLWGGLLLTILIATVGILLSFPLGVILALGRRSSLPAVRILSTAYIELIRGVPLVTILFMADIMLPLFLPQELRIDRVARAIGGITLFSAAYVAENVRGGLQAIPSGQIEAAHALGLNTPQTNIFIVLPQALRAVIPANVGLFISLLKDTTLVTIVGLLELLGIGRAVLAQPQSLGAQLEVYVFIGFVFFLLCYAMSQASYRLETALGVGTR